MSVTYGFYDSLNGDRKYNAKQISELFDGLIRDGVFMSIGDALVVSAGGGMNITVGTGRAWFNHTWTYNDALLILQVDQSEIALNRIDTVVLEVNSNINVRANTIKIVKGVPSSKPVATELVRNEFVNQYPLAYIYVPAGATEITAANITNTVGTSDCPFVTGIHETFGQHGVTMGHENDIYVAKIGSLFEFTPLEVSYGGVINAIATDDNYVYVGGGTTQTVRKLKKSDLSQVAESASYGGAIYAIAIDDEFIYIGGYTTQTVRKLNKSNLSQVAESANYGGAINTIAVDNDYVYVGGLKTQTVRKLNKSNLSQVAESENCGGIIRAIVVDDEDDEFVYVGGRWGTQTVKRLHKFDLSLIDESESYGGEIYTMAIDDDFIYVGGETQTVKKLNKFDLSQVAKSSPYYGLIYAMAIDDEFVYIGGGWTANLIVRKLRKSDLSRVEESENYGGDINAIATDDEFVYIGGGTTNIKVIENRDLIKIIRRYQ